MVGTPLQHIPDAIIQNRNRPYRCPTSGTQGHCTDRPGHVSHDSEDVRYAEGVATVQTKGNSAKNIRIDGLTPQEPKNSHDISDIRPREGPNQGKEVRVLQPQSGAYDPRQVHTVLTGLQ